MMLKRSSILGILLLFIVSTAAGCASADRGTPRTIDYEGSTGNDEKGTKAYERSIKDNVMFEGEAVGGLKETDIIRKLRAYSEKINTSPKEAKLDEESWEIIRKEGSGKRVNMQKTLDLLFNAEPGSKEELVVDKIPPKTSAKVLDRNIVRIGSYTTKILDDRDSRLNNIQLASERLDYEKIQPGEEFSFNDTLGKRTVKKGYEKAPIIIKTEDGVKKAYGVGGGICQLSSTLYNSVLKADLKVTERHTHSKAVLYVPKGKDATVAYGSSDLKFINTRNHPIMLRVYLYKNKLTVRIYENRNQ